MKEIKLGRHDIVVELSWELLSNPNAPGKAIASLIKVNPEYKGVKLGVVIKAAGSATVGFVPAGQKTKLPSGAAWLAAANRLKNQGKTKTEDWLVVEPVGNGEYWLCAIKSGIPLPGVDIVGDYDSIIAKLEQILIVEGFSLYTSDSRIAEFAKSRINVYETPFEELVEGVVLKEQIKSIGPSKAPYVVLVILLVLGVGGGLWYKQQADLKQHQLEVQQQEDAAAAAKAAAEQKEKAIAAYKAFANKVYEDLQKQVREPIDAPSNSAIIHAWLEAINSISINNNGWALDHVNCDKMACVVTLTKGPWTTNSLLQELHHDVKFNALQPDTASYNIPINITEPARVYTDNDLADTDYIRLHVVSDFQKAAFAQVLLSVKEPQPLIQYVSKFDVNVLEPKFADANNIQGALKIDAGYSVGIFSIDGNKIWSLSGTTDYLNYLFMGVEKLKLSLVDYNWEMNGSYVVRGEKPDLDKLINDQINPAPVVVPTLGAHP